MRLVSREYDLLYTVWCTNEHELYDMKVSPGFFSQLVLKTFYSSSTTNFWPRRRPILIKPKTYTPPLQK